MPLRKLWNSICGRTHGATENTVAAESAAPTQRETPDRSPAASTPKRSETKRSDRVKPVAAQPVVAQPAAAKPAAVQAPAAKPARGILGFGSRSVEPALCKLLKPLKISSLLEVGVDDGARALAIVATVQASNPETKLRYCAIDAFEMGEGPVTLMQFHQRVRAEGVSPQIFPDSIENGLIRVCHTIGRVDVVVIGVTTDRWQNPNTISMLRRVCHPETIVFYSENGKWERFADTTAPAIRKAA
ncbi:hypothetical protein SH528x_000664 [Novipirellula sp. SH528]|uniref:hypothetical protein n=1 Tax=Novipirellula sp. SH528 TaxID=3454466 RepID=UPI003FA108AD